MPNDLLTGNIGDMFAKSIGAQGGIGNVSFDKKEPQKQDKSAKKAKIGSIVAQALAGIGDFLNAREGIQSDFLGRVQGQMLSQQERQQRLAEVRQQQEFASGEAAKERQARTTSQEKAQEFEAQQAQKKFEQARDLFEQQHSIEIADAIEGEKRRATFDLVKQGAEFGYVPGIPLKDFYNNPDAQIEYLSGFEKAARNALDTRFGNRELSIDKKLAEENRRMYASLSFVADQIFRPGAMVRNPQDPTGSFVPVPDFVGEIKRGAMLGRNPNDVVDEFVDSVKSVWGEQFMMLEPELQAAIDAKLRKNALMQYRSQGIALGQSVPQRTPESPGGSVPNVPTMRHR